ncbi:MAG TPA: hypothetical protein VGB77_06595 [Abditibacteriaceae bacterium]|jgi:hypothetical protein
MTAPNIKELRIELPKDATPAEIADAALALMAEPGVAELVSAPAFIGVSVSGKSGNLPGNNPAIRQEMLPMLHFDVDALAQSSGAQRASRKPTLLSKALKIGGPAHQGLSLGQVRKRQQQAERAVSGLQSQLIEQLLSNFNGWDASLELLAIASAGGIDEATLAKQKEKLWNVVERDARVTLREAYCLMWRAGREAAGNFKNYSQDETAELERMYRRQQNFYLNLLKDREQGSGRMGFERRVQMYGASLIQAFWAGQVLADLSHDVFWEWQLGDAEQNCGDCPKIARGGRWKCGIYSARELARLGLFPGAGHTECGAGCKCYLRRVSKPQQRPVGRVLNALKELALVGLKSSSFDGPGRSGRETFERNAKRHVWKHRGRK